MPSHTPLHQRAIERLTLGVCDCNCSRLTVARVRLGRRCSSSPPSSPVILFSNCYTVSTRSFLALWRNKISYLEEADSLYRLIIRFARFHVYLKRKIGDDTNDVNCPYRYIIQDLHVAQLNPICLHCNKNKITWSRRVLVLHAHYQSNKPRAVSIVRTTINEDQIRTNINHLII